jgi:hypothetical protein
MPNPPIPAGLTVRHYCQGIGDCHLLTFSKADGTPFRILIDCGIHTSIAGGPAIVDDIVENLRADIGGRIDVLVLTHEHTDHNSAFEPGADRFAGFTIGELWMAWTESDDDPQARELDKFKEQALTALSGASRRLHAGGRLGLGMRSLRVGLDALLSFNYGLKGERVRAYRRYAESLPKKGVRYLHPEQPPLTVKGLPNLRIYVLAPSRREDYLRITERASEMYRIDGAEEYRIEDAGSASRLAFRLGCALSAYGSGPAVDDAGSPFEPSTGADLEQLRRAGPDSDGHPYRDFVRDHYFGPVRVPAAAPSGEIEPAADGAAHGQGAPSANASAKPDPNTTDQAWRRIDHDWLAPSADLAMQLDAKTNNTSLVLAFELVDTQRVFLFAADAQVGNWLSWGDAKWTLPSGRVVTGPDLIERTVYYKVGHHGSENATLKGKGLERMTSPDLTAFIPTNEADAKKVKWGEMPFHEILTALEERCGKRVVRADGAWKSASGLGLDLPSGCIQDVRTGKTRANSTDPRHRWIEFDLG